ncbi:hypothetical protein [Paracoccus sulfuroxidans]|uniref:Uncharacterized protein n=1 Tax=Paracoccus sulfuroxidans TaxID=384678 RepID=A0A562NB63_9RHOB|nr:hypothetical protein [Paracoccus sulfuroxidans]TWI29377.1 hypothetical protein IQ24_03583 [Paracoccus sulfuroxidans]
MTMPQPSGRQPILPIEKALEEIKLRTPHNFGIGHEGNYPHAAVAALMAAVTDRLSCVDSESAQGMTDTPTAHAGARQDSTPEQAAPDALIVGIAQIIDYPSVYMGGPSRNSMRIATEIVKHHRADLAVPSAPDEVEGLQSIIAASNNVIDGLSAENTAQQAEIERLRAERKQNCIDYCALMERHDDQVNTIARLTAERDEARAATAAAYERAALRYDELWRETNAYKIDQVRALATEAETTALAEIVKRAVVAETRACAEICEEYSKDHGSGMFDRHSAACAAAILARLDQRKEAGA